MTLAYKDVLLGTYLGLYQQESLFSYSAMILLGTSTVELPSLGGSVRDIWVKLEDTVKNVTGTLRIQPEFNVFIQRK